MSAASVFRSRIQALNPSMFLSADHGVTVAANRVSDWESQDATIHGHWAQATPGNQPALILPSFFTKIIGCSVSGTTITKTTVTTAWDSGASSSQVMTGDCTLKWKWPGNFKHEIGGLSAADTSPASGTIGWGWYVLSTGAAQVYELGNNRGTYIAAGGVVANDELEIRRVGTEITYWFKGAKIYTSLVAAPDPLMFDCSMYSLDASIIDVTLTGVTSTSNALLRFDKTRPDMLVGPVVALGNAPYTVAMMLQTSTYVDYIFTDGVLNSNGTHIIGNSAYKYTITHPGVASVSSSIASHPNTVHAAIFRVGGGTWYLKAGGVGTSYALAAQQAPATISVIGAGNAVGVGAGPTTMDLYWIAVFARALSTPEMTELRLAYSERY